MKKIKIIPALFVLVLLLSGCDKLDALKASQAILTEDGILYQEELYLPVVPEGNTLNYNYSNHLFVNVTTPDVPVLLSDAFGQNFYANEDKTILTNGAEWYVHQDKLDAYNESLQKGVRYTDLGFDYYDVNQNEHTDYILTDSEKRLVLSCLSAPIKEDLYIDREIQLFQQSDNGLFRKNGQYNLVVCGANYYVATHDENWNITGLYPATGEAEKLIASFFEKSVVNHDYSYNY